MRADGLFSDEGAEGVDIPRKWSVWICLGVERS